MLLATDMILILFLTIDSMNKRLHLNINYEFPSTKSSLIILQSIFEHV